VYAAVPVIDIAVEAYELLDNGVHFGVDAIYGNWFAEASTAGECCASSQDGHGGDA